MEKYFNFECNNKLFEKYKSFIPNIEERLNKSQNTENIRIIEMLCGHKLPKTFVDFYSKFDGEKHDSYLGMILGLMLMSADEIIQTIKNFSNMHFEVTSMDKGVVKEDTIANRSLIPFAFDENGCIIAIDMSPDKNGRKGQIITIDIGSKESYLLAYNFEEFSDFILEMFDSNKFFTLLGDDDTLYFGLESAHFFNTLDDEYEISEKDLKKIKLTDEYWKQCYNDVLTNDNTVSIGFLKCKTSLFVIGEKLSLNPLMYMTNLKELILHDCIITDFSFISKAENLRKIYLANCKFNKEELTSLVNMPNLSVLSLNCMEIHSIRNLSALKSLKELSLRKIDNFNIDEISLFKNLKNLYIDDLDIKNFNFLNSLKKLKELTIKNIKVDNLNYLKNLKNLRSFVLNEKTEDESNLSLITGLKKIEEFQYPVSNMEFYKYSKYLRTVGVDARNIYNIEMLKDTNINNIIVYNALSEEEAGEIISKIQEYITLYSYKSLSSI